MEKKITTTKASDDRRRLEYFRNRNATLLTIRTGSPEERAFIDAVAKANRMPDTATWLNHFAYPMVLDLARKHAERLGVPVPKGIRKD